MDGQRAANDTGGEPTAWRLGLDLGTNSLGWAALQLDAAGRPCGFLAAGSRIFSDGRDPKSGASLAADRRAARAMRRGRDRFKRRQAALLKHLTLDGLFPADAEARRALALLDPFELRARALDDAPLPLPELGRALFHLNQRRGFKSNRKADRGQEDESGKVKIGVQRLHRLIEEKGARTFGEFLHLRRADAPDANAIPSVRTRLRAESGDGAKGDGYDFYPDRALLEDEFDAIWDAQAPHHADMLTPEVRERLHEIIFHQRPLKAPRVGQCTLVHGEERLAKAHPLFQRRRLLEEVNALKIVLPGQVAQPLAQDQRDLLVLKLKDKAKVSFESLRKTLRLDPAARFNKESENRTELKGDEVAAQMAAKTRFGGRWAHLSAEQQAGIVGCLQDVESDADDAAFRAWLIAEFALAPEAARAVLGARLPQGHGRYGLSATTKLIEVMTAGVVMQWEAVPLAGLGHHSDYRTGEIFQDAQGRPALPYYGVALERHIMPGSGDPADADDVRVGRLTNPTVHIGLNQLRRVVNALICRFGPPREIALELARELKLSDDEKKQRSQENNRNRIAAEIRSNKLGEIGQRDGGANRALLRLWEELSPDVLSRRCIYTGQQISIDMLFSGEVEVDHILPLAATLDDSNANKIVCLREANRFKRKRSPFEAWGDDPERWDAIAERAARLPRNKRWRFEPDAMSRFAEEGGFLARHLVDTQHLGVLARDYLATLYPGSGEGSSHVWVSPGRLTEMVRRKLGLNDLLPDHNFGGGADQPKNRLDHRHHAIDAAVIAVVDRGMIAAIARASGLEGAEGRERVMVPEPWPNFRDDLRTTLGRITVAHRADHGTVSKAGLAPGHDQTAGRLHNDTAYGFTGDHDAKGTPIVVHRVPLGSFKRPADLDGVRDPVLRAALRDFTQGYDGKLFEARLKQFPDLGHVAYRRLRRIRKIEPLSLVPIRDAEGRIYKGYKGDSNYRYDIWQMPDGKWRCDVLSMFQAHQNQDRPRPHPAAKRIMSLHRDDILAIERTPGMRELVRVVKFSDKQFAVAPPAEGGALKARDADPGDPFRYIYPSPNTLKAWRARKVGVDEIGHVRDPGFPMRTAVRRTRPRAQAAE